MFCNLLHVISSLFQTSELLLSRRSVRWVLSKQLRNAVGDLGLRRRGCGARVHVREHLLITAVYITHGKSGEIPVVIRHLSSAVTVTKVIVIVVKTGSAS
jgi:hypothetical protein